MTDKEVEEHIASAVALGIEKQREEERAKLDAKNKKTNRVAFWVLVAIVAIFICIWGYATSWVSAPTKDEAVAMCKESLASFGINTELGASDSHYEQANYINEPEKAWLGRLQMKGTPMTEDGDEEAVNCVASKKRVYNLYYHPAGSDGGNITLMRDGQAVSQE